MVGTIDKHVIVRCSALADGIEQEQDDVRHLLHVSAVKYSLQKRWRWTSIN